MSVDFSTPAAVAKAMTDVAGSAQAGFEIGTSANGYEVYTNVLNTMGGMMATSPMGAPINAAAVANGALASYQKWSTGTLETSDVLGFTGTAMTLAIAAAALAGVPVTAGALALAFGVTIVSGWPLKKPVNDLARELADWILENPSSELVKAPSTQPEFWSRPVRHSGTWFDPETHPFGPIPLIGEVCNRDYVLARTWTAPRDPLILDLDADGIEATAINTSNPILFDHDADGIRTATGWIKADDGIVVLDLNGNGTSDSGRELFGDNTLLADGTKAANGYQALAQYDGNADGKISAADAIYTQLRVWQDANQDGVSHSGELRTLAQLGIASIGVTGQASSVVLGNGNTQPWSGSFTRTNGSTGASGTPELSGSLLLASNNFFRTFTDEVPLSAEAAALPAMQGSGVVRDLQEAMSLGTAAAADLLAAVRAFAAATTRDAQMALLDDLISKWGATSGKQLTSTYKYNLVDDGTGHFVTADFTDESSPGVRVLFVSTGGTAADGEVVLRRLNVLESFNGDKFTFNAVPMDQPGSATNSTGAEEGAVRYLSTVSSAQIQLLDQAYESLRASVYEALVVQTRLKPYLDAVELVIDENGLSFDVDPVLALLASRHAADERNALIDLVELNRFQSPALEGVGFDGLGLLQQWMDMLPPDSPLRQEFAGTFHVGTGNAVATSDADVVLGTAGNDSLNGQGGDDSLVGSDGADTLVGGAGSDLVRGDAGNDSLVGEAGDDTFEGGAGNDTIEGQDGSDVYRFSRGDGQDTLVSRWDSTPGKIDVLQFGEGIAPSDVILSRVGTSSTNAATLVIRIAGSSDQLTGQHFFEGDNPANGYNPLQQVQFADGTVWDVAAIVAKALAGTDAGESIVGTLGGDTLSSLGGNDTVYGQAGNDTLSGGDGNDTLWGGAGLDVLQGNAGNDSLVGEAGADTLEGGAGNDTIEGQDGSDVYLFARGDGQDTLVSRWDGTPGKIDVLRFGEGVAPSDVILSRVGTSSSNAATLLIRIAGTTDQLTVQHFFEGDNPANGYNPLQQVQFADGTVWDVTAMVAKALAGTDAGESIVGTLGADTLSSLGGNDTMYGQAGNDTLSGGDGSDTLWGGAGLDVLQGNAGNDSLVGEVGADTLEGGAGNDAIEGQDGSDVYLFARGDGQDTLVSRWDSAAGKLDVLQFGDGIAPADLVLSRYVTNLVIQVAGTTDQVNVQHFFEGDNPFNYYSPLQQIRFADGSSWSIADMVARVFGGTASADSITGTTAGDSIVGQGGNDTIYGQAGNDTLTGGDGADQLTGGAGADSLAGGAGNDSLAGEAGADTLEGGAGNDTINGREGADLYAFGRGDGQDLVISYWDSAAGKQDVLQFKEGIAPGDVLLSRNVTNLVLQIAGTNDRIEVQHFFEGDNAFNAYSPLQQVKFADGTVWGIPAMLSIFFAGTPGNDAITGTTSADALTGQAGDDTLSGRAGADVLAGGAGNDSLDGGTGADIYRFALGDGQDRIGEYDTAANVVDTLVFESGVSTSEVYLSRVGNDLVLALAGTMDAITVSSYFAPGGGYVVEEIRFADVPGRVVGVAEVNAAVANGGWLG